MTAGVRTRYLSRWFGCGLAIGIVSLFVTSVAHGDDWPGWRGADRSDVSKEKGLLESWPEGGPKKLWTNNSSGLGYAGFAVVGDKLFTLGMENDVEFALCLNASTGKELWRQPIGQRFANGWGDGPRSTPTIDGEQAFFMSAQGDLACLSADSGKKIWAVNMSQFGGTIPAWGYAESPLVDGDRVICTPGNEKGAMVALSKKDGKLLWQTKDLVAAPHYSSPIVAEWKGKRQYIQLLVDSVVGVDSASGKVLWQSEFPGRTAVIPTPIFSEGKVYVTAGYGAGSKMVSLDDGSAASEVWSNKVMKNHHGGAILVGDHVYGFSDGVGFAVQNFASGELTQKEKSKIKKGAVAFADGRFYFVQEDDGKVMLIDASPNGIEIKGEFVMEPQTERRSPSGRIWVHPVIANGKLYLRDQEIICCYDIQKSK